MSQGFNVHRLGLAHEPHTPHDEFVDLEARTFVHIEYSEEGDGIGQIEIHDLHDSVALLRVQPMLQLIEGDATILVLGAPSYFLQCGPSLHPTQWHDPCSPAQQRRLRTWPLRRS